MSVIFRDKLWVFGCCLYLVLVGVSMLSGQKNKGIKEGGVT